MRLLRERRSLTFNALSLMTATVATNALGLVFWTEAARIGTPRVVGRAAAAIAALTLLATISQLNLTNVFVRLLPSAGRLGRRLIARGYVAVVALSLVVGAVYVFSGLGDGVVRGGIATQIAFVVAVPVLAVFALQDSVLTALRRAPWVAAENISFATGKLALLPALLLLPIGGGIVISWVVPAAVAVTVVSALLFCRLLRGLEHTEGTLPPRRRLMSFVAGEYVTAVWATAATQLMPLIVVWRLGPAQVAYFTLPWLISMGITLLLWNVASAFVVELAGAHDRSGELLQRTLLLWAGVVGAALAVCVFAAGPLLSLSGASYAAHGTELLRLIGCSAPFTALVALYCMLMWIDQRVWLLAAFQAAFGVALLAATLVLLPRLGLVAVGWANLGVQALAAIGTLPLTARRMRAGVLVAAT
ncbi:MAG: oligosaccharide flippase family protein [Solirubrobacteraceae bacterium]